MLCITDVRKCPGWTPTTCGRVHKDEPGDYWMHRCNPLAVPKNDTATVLSCKPQAVNGTFQCYFGQVHLPLCQCRGKERSAGEESGWVGEGRIGGWGGGGSEGSETSRRGRGLNL